MKCDLLALPLLLLTLLLSACVSPPTVSEHVKIFEAKPAQYVGVASVPKEVLNVGDNRELTVRKLDIGQFAWGKSPFYAMQLPVSDQPYYLVVKSFIGRPLDWYSTFVTSLYGGTPWVFFPYLVFLDKDMNIIGHSKTDDFQVNRHVYTFIVNRMGESWIQAAFPINPAGPRPYYAVITTSLDYVAKVGALPSYYWPSLGGYMHPRIVYAPILSPMPDYSGPMERLHYANLGEIQVRLVSPLDLLKTTYGRKMKAQSSAKPLPPNQLFRKEDIVIHAPNADGYEVIDQSSSEYVHMAFSKSLGAGQEITMFAQSWHVKLKSIDWDRVVNDVIEEHSLALADLSYYLKEFSALHGHCKRIDFKAKHPRFFLADIKGFDIICSQDESDLRVRIGASILSSPAYPAAKALPVEAEEFVNGISLSN